MKSNHVTQFSALSTILEFVGWGPDSARGVTFTLWIGFHWELLYYSCKWSLQRLKMCMVKQTSWKANVSRPFLLHVHVFAVRPRLLYITGQHEVVLPDQINVTCGYSGFPSPILTITAPGLTSQEVISMSTTDTGRHVYMAILRTKVDWYSKTGMQLSSYHSVH